jgi:transcriptional regulator with XRE-family HTH domain
MQSYTRKIRESKKLTLDQVADLIGVTKAQVSKMERGLIRLNEEWLDKLSKVYNCSVHDLIDDDKPQRLLSPKNTDVDFVTIPMLGKIDARQVGMVEYSTPDQQYSLRCAPPSLDILRDSRLTAFTLSGNLLDAYRDGTQLIFANLDDKNKSLLKDGSIVLCENKDREGRECGYFLRIIEIDKHGHPYAVFKIKQGRNSFSVLVNTLLTGSIPMEDMIEVFTRIDAGKAPKKSTKIDISLQNPQINIKAILVKSIRDEL